ncbi:type II secretion system F family protein [Anaerosacchariphilus polymeriproducens]|uniref:Type II secretion system protein GspF domain-containing protein n=1 Tax=Anaerosacchariphilus polymeriproducens TaxID=1812858 RepID=A0A371AZV7_9FIRM|nr:type II secretion system F family protein [Anaerosacchariphilus polymeriproducens]RDU25073.1 hypothetical protein DWV06_00815 [Anaerosacchariphilus polymeriproducens]
MFIHIFIFIVFLIGILCGLKRNYKGGLFCKIAWIIMEVLNKCGCMKAVGRRVKKSLQLLFPDIDSDYKLKEFYFESLKMVLIILFIGNFVGLFVQLTGNESSVTNGYLIRNSYGKGERTENLIADIEGEKDEKKVDVTVSERQFSKDEVEKIFQLAKKEVEHKFLNKNKSVDRVVEKVDLVKKAYKGLVDVEWEITPFGLIDYTGRIVKKDISKKGELGKVTAHLQYFENEYFYTFYIKIFPAVNSQLSILEKLEMQIKEKNKETITNPKIKLPLSINNRAITWKRRKKYINIWIIILSTVISIGIILKRIRDLKDMVKEREKQMLIDYSRVVTKLLLLLEAGAPVSQAWTRIVFDYKKQKEGGIIKYRYIYEEMLITYYEIRDGYTEIEALERFGRRCRVQKYLKLSGILVQNIRQGTKEIKRLLQNEMNQALEERKSMARKLGEEAGTKLLLPMMMLLIVVLIIVAVPAFWAL